MKPLTGPHAFGLISAPLCDDPIYNGSERRLTPDKPAPVARKTRRSALVLFVIAVVASIASVPVSYAIHQHFHP